MLRWYLSFSSFVILCSLALMAYKLETYGFNFGVYPLIIFVVALIHAGWTNKSEFGDLKSNRFWIGVGFIFSSYGIDWIATNILTWLGASFDVVKDIGSLLFVLSIVVGNLFCFVLPDRAAADRPRAGPFLPRR
jgi:hypothetical protein